MFQQLKSIKGQTNNCQQPTRQERCRETLTALLKCIRFQLTLTMKVLNAFVRHHKCPRMYFRPFKFEGFDLDGETTQVSTSTFHSRS